MSQSAAPEARPAVPVADLDADPAGAAGPVPPADLVDPALTGPRLRAALAAMPGYVPGAPPRAPEGLTPYKLSSNENPHPPLPGVLEAVAAAAADLNRYPDGASAALVAALAADLDVDPGCLVLGTGSVAVLGHVVAAACEAGDEVVHAWRSFEAYPIVVTVAGAVPVPVPLDAAGRHDVDAMVAALTDRTRAVLVCTPNNPTGPVVAAAELERLLDAVPRDVLVVVDEAYVEFVRDPAAADGLAAWRERPNVVVLRTFSKAYGLAGLRVGFAVAHPEVARVLRLATVPFGVTSIAQVAAVASLGAKDELLARVGALVAERERVAAALADQGWDLPDAQANFVWLPLGERAAEFAAAAGERGLSVRPFAGEGVRVSVGEVEANDRFLDLAAGWVAAGRQVDATAAPHTAAAPPSASANSPSTDR